MKGIIILSYIYIYMVKTRNYGRRKAKKHTRRRRYKTSFRKHRSVRKRRTKQKRKRGGYQEVDLYEIGLTRLQNADTPELVKQACEQIQSSLGIKIRTRGCKRENDIKDCRNEKKDVLLNIQKVLTEKMDTYTSADDEEGRVKRANAELSKTLKIVNKKLSKYNTIVREEQPKDDHDENSRWSFEIGT
jgi:hypothetical protein